MVDRAGISADTADMTAIFGCTISSDYRDLSLDELSKLFSRRALELECMGLTSHAAVMAARGIDHCISRNDGIALCISEESPSISVLNELSIQLQHFSRALYAGILPPDASFIDNWVNNTITENISNILHSLTGSSSDIERESSGSNTSLVLELLTEHIRPMSEGALRSFQWCSPTEFVEGLIASLNLGSEEGATINYNGRTLTDALEKCLRRHKDGDVDPILQHLHRKVNNGAICDNSEIVKVDLLLEDAFERAVVSSLGEMLRNGNGCLRGLRMVLAVAVASIPTLPKIDRCLRSPLRLASLVVTTCTLFDNTYLPSTVSSSSTTSTSQPLMWSLIETTPTSLKEFDIDGAIVESEMISSQLDAIQAALSVCEIIQCYMVPPPLFLLLGDQSEREGKTTSHGLDCSSLRSSRRTYVGDLLTGCGFLIGGLGESISVLQSQSCGIGVEDRITSRKDGGGTNLSASRSTSVEVLCNMVSLGQALILRLSFEYGRKQEQLKSNSYSLVNNDNAGSWTAVAQDINHLCKYFTSKSVPTVWAGHALLQCMLHYNGMDRDFKRALEGVIDREQEKGACDASAEGRAGIVETHPSLGTILVALGVESAHMECLVLKSAVDIFNSVPSCDSKELREVEQLLQLLPQYSSSAAVASSVRTERALMELVTLLSTLQVDLLPLQLRLLSPVDIAVKLLEQRPQAYYEVNGNGEFEEMYSSRRGDAGENEDRQDLILRRTMLRDRPPPGARLVRVLSALQSHSNSDLDPPSVAASAIHTLESEIRLELLFAAISLGELEGAYCLCRALLNTQATISKSSSEVGGGNSQPTNNIAKRISEATLLVIGMLDCPDPDSGDLHQALRYDLLSLTLANTPVCELERYSALWRHLPAPTSTSASSSSSSSSVCRAACIEASQERDEVHIAKARDGLLDMVARMLRRSEDCGSYIPTFLPNSSEMVISAGVDSSRLADAIGHLLLVENSEMVHGLVEKLYADLDKKLSATLVRERQTLTHSSRGRNTTLDEALVNRVACKGFSKNSAKRAVLATMGEGFQQALEWAVEHSLDEDFEYPIAESVKGALLSERQEGLSSFDPESMRSVLQVLADVSEMYMHHCSIRSSAVTTTAADEHSSERSLGVEFTIDEMYPGVDTPDKTYTMALINSEPPTTVKAVGKRVVSGEKFDSFEAAGLVPSSPPLVNQPPSRFSFSSPESQSSQILSRAIEERPLLRSTMAIAETAQTSSISTSSDDALEAIVVLEGERRSKGDLKPSLLVPTSVAKIATAAKVAATNQLLAAGVRKASEPSESARAESQPSTVTSLGVSPVRVGAPLAVPTIMTTRSAALAEAIAPTTSTTPLRPPILVPTSVAKVAAAAEVAAANQLQAAGVRKASKMTLLPSESVSGESQPSTRPAYLASTSGPTSETVTSLAVSPVGIAASPAVPTAMKTRSAALAEAIAAAAAATPPRPRPPKVLQAAQSSSPTSPTIIAHMALTDTAILPLTSPTSPPPRSLPPWPILSPSVPCTPTEILPTAALIPETIVAASFGSTPTGPGSSISLRPTIAVNPPPALPTRAATLTKIDKINDSKHGVPTTTTTAAITVPIQDPAAVPVSVPIRNPAAVPVPVSFPIRDPASVPVSVPVPFSPMLGSLVSASKSSIGGQIETTASSAVLPLLHAESKTRQVVASRNKDIENLSMSPTNTATANRTISPVLPGKLSHGKEQIISSSRDKVSSTEEISRVEEIVEKTNLPIDVLKRDVMSTTVPLREEIVVSTGCETNDISCAGSLNSISSVELDQKPIVRPIDSANAVQLINSVCVIKSVGNEIAEQEQTTRDDAEATKGVLSKLVNPAVLPASIQAKDASVPPARVSALTTSKNTVLKAHLVSRLRGVLDVAEDFTNMGMHVADLAKSIANEECVGVATGKGKGNGDGDGDGDDESDIDSVSEQLFQICRALATHRRLAAFEFLPQLLAVLPTSLLRSVAARTELLIFVNVTPSSSSSSSSSASSSSGSKAASASATASIADAEEEEQRAKWAMAALRLLAFHTNDDPQTYLPCMPVLYSLTNTYRTIMLFSHLYRGVKGSNINAVMSILKVAEDHLAALKTAVITCDGLAANLYIREASVAIERTTTLSLPSPRSLGSLITSGEGGGDNAPQQSAAAMTIVTAALKQLQEDLAVLRRVNRIPDSEGINSKMLLKLDSGKLRCDYYSLYQP